MEISLLLAKILVLEDGNFSGMHRGISPLLSRISSKLRRLRDIMDPEASKCLDRSAMEAIACIYDAICRYQLHSTKTLQVAVGSPWLCRRICLADQLFPYVLQLERSIDGCAGNYLPAATNVLQNYHLDLYSRPWDVGSRPAFVGDKTVEELLKKLVAGGNKRLVLPIVGARGSGKSTIATQIYLRTRHCFDCSARIRLNDSPTDCTLKSLLSQLEESSHALRAVDDHTTSNVSWEQKLKSFLQNKKYFIVLDGLRSREEWESTWLKILPDDRNGSRVLVTTSHGQVAYTCAPSYYNHQPLNHSDSRALLCVAIGLTGPTLSLAMKERVKNMINRCAGSPFALLLLAGLLSTKRIEKEDWDQVYRMIGSQLHTDVSENMMKVCYDALSGYLKPCYLYFGLFPENYSVQKQRLLRLWIAEGFVEKGSQEATVEDTADRYLQELIRRNLVYASEVGMDGRVRKCRVHVIAYSLISSKLGEKNNFGMRLAAQTDVDKQKKIARRLSITGDANFANFSSCKCLLSLMTFCTSSWPKPCVLRSKLLVVLDLTNSVMDSFPSKIPQHLPYLRFLSLRNTNVKDLPRSIGKLKNLITLDLKGTFLTELPEDIASLTNLHHLLVKPRSSLLRQGTQLCFDITRLEGKLLRLSLIDVNYRPDVVEKIKNMVHLRRLAITNLPAEKGKMLCSSLEQLKQLESLSIAPKEGDHISMDDLHSLPPLRRLYFHGPLLKIPEWIENCHDLTNLRLELVETNDDTLTFLQRLPQLRMIKLQEHTNNNMDRIIFRIDGFNKLAFLHLCNFKMLELIEIQQGAVPGLEKLLITNCPRLKKPPRGLKYLPDFKELQISNSEKRIVLVPPFGECK